MSTRHLLHVRSNQSDSSQNEIVAKLPEASRIEYGEIAVNYGAGYETLSIKNSDNEVVPFPNMHQVNALALAISKTKENVGLNEDLTYTSTEELISADTTVHDAIDTLAERAKNTPTVFKTINGNVITGSGNITIEGGGGGSTVSVSQTLTSSTNTTKLGSITVDGVATDLYSVKSPFEYNENGTGIQPVTGDCIASGDYSYAEGSGTTASGSASHAEGKGTIATNVGEHACGTYNVTGTSQIFSVGVGASDSDRKNGMSLDTSGNMTVLGSITSTGAIYSSDKKLKENINPIFSQDIEKVKEIELKAYNFIADSTNTKKYGVIAQDLEEIGLNNLVSEKEDGTKGVDYISFLILKIQQLENEIKELKKL